MGPLNHQKIDKIRAWTSQGPSLCPPMSQDRPRTVPGSSQGPPGRQSRGAKQPNNNHGQQNPPEINRNPGLDLKVSFVILSCVPQKSQRCEYDKLVYQKAKIRLQQCRESAILECKGRGPAAEGGAHKIIQKQRSKGPCPQD